MAAMSFDPVAAAYEAARPGYPDGLYDALGPLAGLDVVEGGAGTGIATRALRARGARVVALDVGEQVLRRNDGARVVADGARAPLRDGCADLVCFAQAWHWLAHERAVPEVARLLRDGGRWAGWWSHPRDDHQPWVQRYWSVIESMTIARREHRDTDWGARLDPTHFDAPTFTSMPWVREVSIADWLLDERSKSYIGLGDDADRIVAAIESVVRDAFADGPVRIAYETWLWQATVRR